MEFTRVYPQRPGWSPRLNAKRKTMNAQKIHIHNRNKIILRFGVLPESRLKFLRSWVSWFVCHLFQSLKRAPYSGQNQ